MIYQFPLIAPMLPKYGNSGSIGTTEDTTQRKIYGHHWSLITDRGTEHPVIQADKQCCLLQNVAGNIVYVVDYQSIECHDQL